MFHWVEGNSRYHKRVEKVWKTAKPTLGIIYIMVDINKVYLDIVFIKY
jgi:hypothetical protein